MNPDETTDSTEQNQSNSTELTDSNGEQEVVTDINYDDPDFVDPTPDDPVDKNDIIIYLEKKSLENQVKQSQSEIDSLKDLSNKLQTLIEQGENGQVNLSDSQEVNEQILVKLDAIIENQSHMKTGSDTLVTYGVLYIPLAIVVFLFWRFFATFLRSAR